MAIVTTLLQQPYSYFRAAFLSDICGCCQTIIEVQTSFFLVISSNTSQGGICRCLQAI